MISNFKPHQRLLTASAYKPVFDAPDTRAGTGHILLLVKRNNLPHGRLGLVVAKKRVRLAVARNRIKRIMRESFREHQDQLVGLDIVFLTKNGIADLENAVLRDQIDTTWKRVLKRIASIEEN